MTVTPLFPLINELIPSRSLFLTAVLVGCRGQVPAEDGFEDDDDDSAPPIEDTGVDVEDTDTSIDDTGDGQTSLSPFPELETVVYGTTPTGRTFTLVDSECVKVTAAPVVIGDHVVYPLLEEKDCPDEPKYRGLAVGYHAGDEKIHILMDKLEAEGTSRWLPEEGVVLWPTLSQVGLNIIDDETFVSLAKVDGLSAAVDSSPIWLGNRAYFGTVNTPYPPCQDEPNPDCGAFFGVDLDGTIERRIDANDGLRMWMTGSATTDGEFLYLGGGEQTWGADDETYLMGCSMIKVDADLALLAFDDPDQQACFPNGYLESAVSGEPALGPESVWVQFRSPGDDRGKVAVIHYDRDLVEQCRAEFDASIAWGAGGFYQGPTVNAEGSALVTYTLPVGEASVKGHLFQIAPDCTVQTLHLSNNQLRVTPTLADDKWVLLASGDQLLVIDDAGNIVETHELATSAAVSGGPIIEDGRIFVVARDGALTIIDDTAVTGYGDAWWPRFRHDNWGSASLETSDRP